MTSAPAAEKCAHPQCQCQIAAGQEYCSETCKSASHWEPCQCGHAACMTESAAEDVG